MQLTQNGVAIMCLIEGSVFAHYQRKANKFLKKWKTTTICQTHYGYSILGQLHGYFGDMTVLHQKFSNERLSFAVVLPPPPNLFLMLNTYDLKESLPETRV